MLKAFELWSFHLIPGKRDHKISPLGSCLHRLALSERVRGGLILIVPSQLIVDVTQFLVLNW